jgi:transcription initiation factor TFIIIB Brf1 subunit/transcription initiation factor TFIIB
LLSITQEKDPKEITQQSPLYSFMYALKSSEARRQYPKRLKMLFDYLKLPGSLEEQAIEFLEKTREKNIQWQKARITTQQ